MEVNETNTNSIFTYTWKIENFGLFVCNNLNIIRSKPFTLPHNDEDEYYLRLHPHGFDHECRDQLSLFLDCESKRTAQPSPLSTGTIPQNASSNTMMIEKVKILFYNAKVNRFTEISSENAMFPFKALHLMDSLFGDGFLKKDCLVIKCEFYFSSNGQINNPLEHRRYASSSSNADGAVISLRANWTVEEFDVQLKTTLTEPQIHSVQCSHNFDAIQYYLPEQEDGEELKNDLSTPPPLLLFMRLWPNGECSSCHEHIALSVYVECENNEKGKVEGVNYCAHSSISICDRKSNKIYTKVICERMAQMKKFMYHKYLSHAHLQEIEELHKNKCLQIQCEFELFNEREDIDVEQIMNDFSNSPTLWSNNIIRRMNHSRLNNVIIMENSNVIVNNVNMERSRRRRTRRGNNNFIANHNNRIRRRALPNRLA